MNVRPLKRLRARQVHTRPRPRHCTVCTRSSPSWSAITPFPPAALLPIRAASEKGAPSSASTGIPNTIKQHSVSRALAMQASLVVGPLNDSAYPTVFKHVKQAFQAAWVRHQQSHEERTKRVADASALTRR